MDTELIELNQKLDTLTSQVAYLSEQTRIAEQARESRNDLLEAGIPIAREALGLVNEELDDVQDFIQPTDLIRMLKKLIVHGPQLEKLLDQLDSVSDLVDSTGPVVKLGFDSVTNTLDGMERKGYFTFGREVVQIADSVVTSFTEEDLDRLGESVEPLLDVVKELTKPEITGFLRNTVKAVEEEVQKPVETSWSGLYRQLRNPDVRRGLALTLRVLQVVGEQAAGDEKK
ncbi:MAG: DUF1641 domain-containing protein [Chloroflexi bacterium]|nr:DUF1641 domain-containing protein [Chloroflexota bacterium]